MPERNLNREASAYLQALRLQNKLASNYKDAVEELKGNVKLGITPVPPPYQSEEDQKNNFTQQYQMLKDNLKSLIKDPREVEAILDRYKTTSDLFQANQNWPGISEKLKTVKHIDAIFFNQFLDRYYKRLNEPTVAEAVKGLPAPVVNVPAPVVNVPAPVVNVPAPVVNVPAPVVITLPPPQIDVAQILDRVLKEVGITTARQKQALKNKLLQAIGVVNVTNPPPTLPTPAFLQTVASSVAGIPVNTAKLVGTAVYQSIQGMIQAAGVVQKVVKATYETAKFTNNVAVLAQQKLDDLFAAIPFPSAAQFTQVLNNISGLGSAAVSTMVDMLVSAEESLRQQFEPDDEFFDAQQEEKVGELPPRTPVVTRQAKGKVVKILRGLAHLPQGKFEDRLKNGTVNKITDDDITSASPEVAAEVDDYLQQVVDKYNEANPSANAFNWSPKAYANATKWMELFHRIAVLNPYVTSSSSPAKSEPPSTGKKLALVDRRLQQMGDTASLLTKGTGVRSRIFKVSGRGIEPYIPKKYEQFGKYVIHLPSLDKSILNLKFPSFANIPTIPQQLISKDLKDFLLDLLETQKVNQSLFEKLSKSDQQLFTTLCKKASIDKPLGVKCGSDSDDEMKRFELVRGEIMAGNNNPNLLKEMKLLTMKFVSTGKIPKTAGYDLLYEISALV